MNDLTNTKPGSCGFWAPYKIWKVENGLPRQEEDAVTREYNLKVVLNSREVATLTCSPTDLDYLVAGFLFTEGFIGSKNEIVQTSINVEKGIARVEAREATACIGPEETIPDDTPTTDLSEKSKIKATSIFSLAAELQKRSQVFQQTGGVHSAGLAVGEEMLIFMEDIGRYNALDKVCGQCLLEEIPCEDKIVVFSGRVPSKVVKKVAKMGAAVLVARSAPTDLAVELAQKLGITLIGFARSQRMNIYTYPDRIIFNNS